MKHTENNYIKSLKSSQWFLYARIGTVSYVKNTGKPVRRVFDHIGQRLFFVQRRTSVEMIYFDESLDSSGCDLGTYFTDPFFLGICEYVNKLFINDT